MADNHDDVGMSRTSQLLDRLKTMPPCELEKVPTHKAASRGSSLLLRNKYTVVTFTAQNYRMQRYKERERFSDKYCY